MNKRNIDFYNYTNGFLRVFVNSMVADRSKFRKALIGQIITGLLFSIRKPDLLPFGLLIGFLIPACLIYSNYKVFFLVSAMSYGDKPDKITKSPKTFNTAMIAEILFLGVMWFLILSGLYDKNWMRFLFAVLLPSISIFLLRFFHLLMISMAKSSK